MTADPSPTPDTVVLIHGLWMTPRSWEHWAERYRSRGLKVVAPSWPGLEGDVEAIRSDPSPLAGLGIAEIVDHYAAIIQGLDRPPIIMGHSFGGAFTQLLLNRGLGAAGVAVDSAPVKGVLRLPFSTLRTAWPVLKNPANRKRAVPLSLKQYHYRFANHESIEAAAPEYERYCIPAVGRVLFQQAFANFNPKAPSKVDYAKADRAPLLFIIGGIDHVAPPSINHENVKRYQKRSSAVTESREFPGRSHGTVGQDGWQDVADFAIDWAMRQSGASPATG